MLCLRGRNYKWGSENIFIQITTRNEYVPEVEHHISTIKERATSVYNEDFFRNQLNDYN